MLDTRSGKGAVTNVYGHYSLTVRRDSVNLKVSFVGYEPQFFNSSSTPTASSTSNSPPASPSTKSSSLPSAPATSVPPR